METDPETEAVVVPETVDPETEAVVVPETVDPETEAVVVPETVVSETDMGPDSHLGESGTYSRHSKFRLSKRFLLPNKSID